MSKNIKKSIIYSLEPIISKGLTFLLLPLYTAYISVADYGILQFVISLAAFIRIFTKMGTNSAFWKFSNDKLLKNNGNILKNLVFFQIAFGLVVIGVLLTITYLLNYEITTWLLLIYFISLVIKTFTEIILLQFRYDGFAVKYLITTISILILNISITIYFVVHLEMGLLGIVYSYLISFSIITIYALPILVKKFNGRLSFIKINEFLKFGWPLMLGNVFLLLISLSDRWFILKMLNENELGHYSYVYKFSDLTLTFLVYSFNIVFVPIMWKAYKLNSFNILFHKIEKNIIIIFPVISLVIILISILLANFFTLNEDYVSAFNLIVLLSFSHLFYGIYLFQVLKIQMYSNTRSILYITFFSALLNCILNFILINFYGIVGAAISTFISYLILMILMDYKASKVRKTVKNTFSFNFSILLIFLIAFSSIQLFDIFQIYWQRIVICFLFIILYLLISVLFRLTNFDKLKKDFNFIFDKSDKIQ